MEVVTTTPDHLALPLELLQLQLFSLVGVAPDAQLLLSSRGQLLVPSAAATDRDELLLPRDDSEQWPRLFLLDSTTSEREPLPTDWQSVCSRVAFGGVPVVQCAFAATTGALVCHACATTCTKGANWSKKPPVASGGWWLDMLLAYVNGGLVVFCT